MSREKREEFLIDWLFLRLDHAKGVGMVRGLLVNHLVEFDDRVGANHHKPVVVLFSKSERCKGRNDR